MFAAVGRQGAAVSGGRQRGEIDVSRKEWRNIQKKLRECKRAQGLAPLATATLPNRTSDYESVSEEKQARLEAVTEQVKILREKLPILLRRLRTIPDLRDPELRVADELPPGGESRAVAADVQGEPETSVSRTC